MWISAEPHGSYRTSKEQQEEIYNLIANRNFFGVEELLEQADASPD